VARGVVVILAMSATLRRFNGSSHISTTALPLVETTPNCDNDAPSSDFFGEHNLKTAIVYRHGGDRHALLLDEFDHIQCPNWEAFCEALLLSGVTHVAPARHDQMPAAATIEGMNIDGINRYLTQSGEISDAPTHEGMSCQQN
jgi:hypothetical protein